MAVIGGINLAAGMVFYVLGAWPVVGFMGLDVALVWWAFRKNFAMPGWPSASRSPRDELVLERLPKGRRPGASLYPAAGCRWNSKRTRPAS